jgi:hypothetical protein
MANWKVQTPHGEWDAACPLLPGHTPTATPPGMKLAALLSSGAQFLKRPIATYIQGVIVRVFIERLIKPINLFAITSLKTIQHMMDKVMNLNGGLITEPG